jgi:hypothetical protein
MVDTDKGTTLNSVAEFCNLLQNIDLVYPVDAIPGLLPNGIPSCHLAYQDTCKYTLGEQCSYKKYEVWDAAEQIVNLIDHERGRLGDSDYSNIYLAGFGQGA